METRSVLLYGSSMLISLVTASLKECPDLRIAQARSWPEASRSLADHFPDVLIFDLGGSCESDVLPLLLENSALLLVGLDLEANRAVLVSGREARALTLDQIRELAQSQERLAPVLTNSSQRSARLSRPATRRQKLAFAFGVVFVTACLGIVLLQREQENLVLFGAAVGPLPAQVGLAFLAGLLLGGVALGLWTWRRR